MCRRNDDWWWVWFFDISVISLDASGILLNNQKQSNILSCLAARVFFVLGWNSSLRLLWSFFISLRKTLLTVFNGVVFIVYGRVCSFFSRGDEVNHVFNYYWIIFNVYLIFILYLYDRVKALWIIPRELFAGKSCAPDSEPGQYWVPGPTWFFVPRQRTLNMMRTLHTCGSKNKFGYLLYVQLYPSVPCTSLQPQNIEKIKLALKHYE